MDGLNHSKEPPEQRPRQPDELSLSGEKLYELYCQYAEASRAAMLRVTLCPEDRHSITEEPVLEKGDFLARVDAMPEEVRREFLRRVTSGYEIARIIYGGELLRKFRPAT